jgi:hypothetical protein
MLNYFNEKYGEKINIIVLYISEAHVADEWPLSNKFVINQHKTVEDRLEAVKLLEMEIKLGCPIYLDNLELPNFEKSYFCWPDRGFIMNKGIVEYLYFPKVNAGMHWDDEIEQWLDKYFTH